MIIAVDDQIPYGEKAFSQFGAVRLFAGRNLQPDFIRDAEALVVRTVTPVTSSLLDGTAVRFVAAATAGFDHVDRDYLQSRGIHFFYAAGCNAYSVSEYVVTALHIIASRKGWDLKHKSIAVIGVGNVGSRVARKAELLGMNVLLCDPPLRESTGDPRYKDFDDVLKADILTFHVPLTREGPYPTYQMLDRRRLDELSSDQFILNTSRGEVIEGAALKSVLTRRSISGAVLDVWENEPAVDFELLRLADIGTPHIAGVSLDGKIRATEMVREELGRFLKTESYGLSDAVYPEQEIIRPASHGRDAVLSVLEQAFRLLKKDEALRALDTATPDKALKGFDELRNERPLRLEFCHFTVDLDETRIDLAPVFENLGFRTRMAGSQ